MRAVGIVELIDANVRPKNLCHNIWCSTWYWSSDYNSNRIGNNPVLYNHLELAFISHNGKQNNYLNILFVNWILCCFQYIWFCVFFHQGNYHWKQCDLKYARQMKPSECLKSIHLILALISGYLLCTFHFNSFNSHVHLHAHFINVVVATSCHIHMSHKQNHIIDMCNNSLKCKCIYSFYFWRINMSMCECMLVGSCSRHQIHQINRPVRKSNMHTQLNMQQSECQWENEVQTQQRK